MKFSFLKFNLICVLLLFFLTSCNTDYLNISSTSSGVSLSSTEIFNTITKDLAIENFKKLNDEDILNLYAIDPKLLIDYTSNIPADITTGEEISIFRLKDSLNVPEVILGIERRVSELEKEFRLNKPDKYNLIKNPYIKVFDNYVVFALSNNIETLNKNLENIFK